MSKFETNNVDTRTGAYDPITKDGLPQPQQVTEKITPHQREQQGADVRGEATPGIEAVLPEGLVRKRTDPLNSRTGRRPTD